MVDKRQCRRVNRLPFSGAISEWRSAQYLYLWALWLFMLLIGLMMKWKMTYLWLWTVPVLALLYCAFLQAAPPS